MDDEAGPSSSTDQSNMEEETLTLLTIPTEVLHVIFSNLTFAEVAESRLVCKHFDKVGQLYLNQGFRKLCSFHSSCSKQLKAQLPRRESERRTHPLARHCDILSAVETRLSLLAMTYMKYIEMQLCCFIPGKVIDESYFVMHYVMKTPKPPRPHEILQELRDISSMAMEHFDEKVVPILKKRMPGVVSVPTVVTTAAVVSSKSSDSSMTTSSLPRSDYIRMEQQLKRATLQTVILKKQVQGLKTQRSEDKKIIDEQGQKLVHQGQTIAELSSQVAAQELKMNDLDRRLLEFSRQLEDRFDNGSQRTVNRRRKAAVSATEDNDSVAGSSHKTKRARRK
ncbi:uncharacterized protein [Amphiura filiformis]|uniref:uncharacterized protein n=1 Tax=Amphiura filiformis TaxID=82378 RepID=UPI003B217DA0